MLASFLVGLRAKFPSVQHLSTDGLKDLLKSRTVSELDISDGKRYQFAKVKNIETGESVNLFLLDVRSREEYDVSHLPLAIYTPPETEDDQLKAMIHAMTESESSLTKLVCYCSVGYRSSIMVQRINKLKNGDEKMKDVTSYNLDGSIFKWATENKELVNDKNDKANLVHPYNWIFGKMLDEKKRWNIK